MRKIKVIGVIILLIFILSTNVKALTEKIENEESNITEKIVDENNTSENITEENNTQENVTEPEQNHEEENNYYEPEYPSYNPPRYEESKSENANLRIIKIENMEPEFDKDTTEYYLTVDLNTEKIDIETYTDSEKAKVAIYGNENLKEGNSCYSGSRKSENILYICNKN